jgi:hypothetical protein
MLNLEVSHVFDEARSLRKGKECLEALGEEVKVLDTLLRKESIPELIVGLVGQIAAAGPKISKVMDVKMADDIFQHFHRE